MPLLKRKTLDKVPMPEFLRDDELVFHCEMTSEIFRDYEEFAERTLLCNSMVWTCSMTGKSNLTYEEALNSEESARKMLGEFPKELIRPLLYVASLTKRSSFGEMAEDVYIYVKDRYFIGEYIEASFGNTWQGDYKVTQVIAPSSQEIKDNEKRNKEINLSSSLFKYNLEQLSAEEEDVSEVIIANMSMMRRKKTSFNRDKCKLFLKQCVEPSKSGFITIKQSALEQYGADKILFEQIFSGENPQFEISKGKSIPKKTKQETLAKFLTKNNIVASSNGNNEKTYTSTFKSMSKEELKAKKLQEKEDKQKEKDLLKQKNMEVAVQLKEYYNQKEDLLLQDQKELPCTTPITSRIPTKYLDTAISIVEFVNTFGEVLRTRDYFPRGFTFLSIETALLDDTLEGVFHDLILLLLESMYSLQGDEVKRLRLAEKDSPVSDLENMELTGDVTISQATKLASIAQTWCLKNYGQRFNALAVNRLTLSEILRLHFLTSGADNLTDFGNKLRSAHRGGYYCSDDPGVYFRLNNSYIIEALSLHNVVQLGIGDKLKVLDCLVNQLLTFKEIRDVIGKQREKVVEVVDEIKGMKLKQRKIVQEFQSERTKIKKQKSVKPLEKITAELAKLEEEFEKKQKDDEYELNELYKSSLDGVNLLGYDRAFRRYYKMDSFPAILVNEMEVNVGTCLQEPIKQIPELVDADRDVILNYIHAHSANIHKENDIKEELNSSDKENEPKDDLMNGNIESKNETTIQTNGKDHSMDVDLCNKLDMCTSDPSNCNVHGTSYKRKWRFFSNRNELDKLKSSLNHRGRREGELLNAIAPVIDELGNIIGKTPPLDKLNELKPNNGRQVTCGSLHDMLNESLLDFEERLYLCNIGGIQKNRNQWVKCIKERTYDQIELKDYGVPEHLLQYTEYIDSNVMQKDVEPGKFIPRKTMKIESEDLSEDTDNIILVQSKDDENNIRHLALALIIVSNTIKPLFLKKPFGEVDGKNEHVCSEKLMSFWRQSLINSTSFSQVFLHYTTLDESLHWRKSKSMRDNCVLCLKGNNPTKILLCDSCDKGHHIYCLKPKLTEIPKGDWFCNKCKEEQAANNYASVGEEEIQPDEEEDEEDASSLSSYSKSESNELTYCMVCNEVESNMMLRCYDCPRVYHFECHVPPLKRMPRGKWLCTKCKTNQNMRRSNRVRDEASDLPLHNVALQELLNDVMKHDDSWPFIRPVQKNEVPDYYEIIAKPMDFGTIKYKLNMGVYKFDEHLMEDVQLVFENCNTYNNSEDDVYKCGVSVGEYLVKRCEELNLKVPNSIMEMFAEPSRKKKRTK